MAERTKEFKVRMTIDEFSILNDKVQKCGMSREKFVRLVLNDYQLKELPSIDYFYLIKELNANGNNLNQIVKLAYACEFDVTRLNEIVGKHEQLLLELDKQVRGKS
ncbi:MAG: MbeCy [Longicatena sp.]